MKCSHKEKMFSCNYEETSGDRKGWCCFFCLVMIRKCVTKLHNMGTHWKPVSAARGVHLFCTAEQLKCHSVLKYLFFNCNFTDQLPVTASVSAAVEQLFLLTEDVLFQTRAKKTHSRLENNCLLVMCGSHMAVLSSLCSHICLQIFLSTAPFFSFIWRCILFTEEGQA